MESNERTRLSLMCGTGGVMEAGCGWCVGETGGVRKGREEGEGGRVAALERREGRETGDRL
jgi:hypothetical protein